MKIQQDFQKVEGSVINMKSEDLREKFLSFFEEKGHKRLPSSSLIPENDPSVLFTTAGMHPLVPYLLGEKHPLGKRLTDVQKCLRTDDIEEVGDSQHLTFFEMLGYWSLGDYFKKESIEFTFGFYTEVLGFDKDDISVTVFAGEDDVAFDQESFDTWKNVIGIPEERIYKYEKKENWWGPVGETGPCGPCTEMFIDTGIEACGPDCGPSCNCDKFVEIGNNVFMEFNKTVDGKFEKLAQHNVDVGLGFERLAMFSQNKTDVFQIDIFEPIMKKIEEITGLEYGDKSDEEYINNDKQCWVDVRKQMRIVADHTRAAVFAIADGSIPSNKGAGYVVRRLIRRSLEQLYLMVGDRLKDPFQVIVPVVIEVFHGVYDLKKVDVLDVLLKEGDKYSDILLNSHRYFTDIKLDAKRLFHLKQSFGYSPEIIFEIQKQRYKLEYSDSEKKDLLKGFKELESEHQELSRTASAGMFKGGLADNKVETTRLHTAAHLLLAALRHELNPDIEQKGSNITEERLRFDFNFPEKMTDEQIKKVEDLVNLKIEESLPVTMQELSVEDAKKSGATGSFHDKYGETVKIFNIGNLEEPFSREICGGPHVGNTSELGHFKITKEESSSAGVRRIKAILN